MLGIFQILLSINQALDRSIDSMDEFNFFGEIQHDPSIAASKIQNDVFAAHPFEHKIDLRLQILLNA